MPFVIVYVSGDIDYPKQNWWEVWYEDQQRIAGFTTQAEAETYCAECNAEYAAS